MCEVWGFRLGTGVKAVKEFVGLERSARCGGIAKGVMEVVRRIKKWSSGGKKRMEKNKY